MSLVSDIVEILSDQILTDIGRREAAYRNPPKTEEDAVIKTDNISRYTRRIEELREFRDQIEDRLGKLCL